MRVATWTIWAVLALGACDKPEGDDTGDQDTDTGPEDTDTDTDTGPSNAAPTPAADTVNTDEDTPTVTIQPVGNDTDPDGDTLTIVSLDDSATTGTVSLEGSLTVLWHPGASFQGLGDGGQGTDSFSYTVSDGELTATATVTVNVSGVNDAPILTTPANRTDDEGTLINVQVGVADPDDSSLSWSASGLPPGVTINTTTGRLQGRISASAAPGSPYAPQINVNDGLVSDSASFSWTVDEANVPPLFEDPGEQTNAENDDVTLQIVAEDPEGVTPLAWSATGLPAGLSINPSTGEITGTITFAAAAGSPYDVVVSASDGLSNGEQPFTWNVTNTNRPPDLTGPGTQSDAEGDEISLSLSATDPDSDSLTWSAEGLPPGLEISPGEISGTLSYDASGEYAVTVEVSDGEDIDKVEFAWTVDNTNRLPVFTGPGNQTHAEGESVFIEVEVTDPDGEALTLSPQGLLPSAVSLEDGYLTGTLKYDSEGVAHVTIRAEDPHGHTDHSFDWTVTHTNVPPQFGTISGRGDAEGVTITPFSHLATDFDGDELSYTATGLPPGISIASNGVMSGTIPYDVLGSTGTLTFQVEVTADDGVDTDMVPFDWDVDATNRPPVVDPVDNLTHTEGEGVSLRVTATDPDGDAIVQWDASGLPASLVIETQSDGSGLIAGTLGYSEAGSYSITVKAYDANTETDTDTFDLTVNEGVLPLCDREFVDETTTYGFGDLTKGGTAIAWFDADQDDDIDVFVRNLGMFLNEGGVFVDVRGEIGMEVGIGAHGLAVGDVNGDGFPDVFVPNDSTVAVGRETPVNHLYINKGLEGTSWTGFLDQAEPYKVDVPETRPGGAAFNDPDGDHDHDLTFAAEFGTSHQWRNEGQTAPFEIDDELFQTKGDLSGECLAWADPDPEQRAELYLVGLSEAADARYYVHDGDKWHDTEAGLQPPDDPLNPLYSSYGGPTWVDLNHDGDLDLHLVTVGADGSGGGEDLAFLDDGESFLPGSVPELLLGDSEESNSSANWYDYDLDGDLDALLVDVGLFRNDGDGMFSDVSSSFGLFPEGARAGAWADLDGDLFPELLLATDNGLSLFANQAAKGAECDEGGRRRIIVLTDVSGDPDDEPAAVFEPDYPALGAKVFVDLDGDGDFGTKSPDRLAVHLIGQGQSGRAAYNDVNVPIGLGQSLDVDIKVVFPDGTVVTHADVPSNKQPLYILDE